MFSSNRFIVSGLSFRPLIHFEFIFEYGVKECSNFILLHVAVKEWAFCPVPLIYISVFVPVPYCLDYCSFLVYSEVPEPDSSSSIFHSQDCFGYLGSFVLPYRF